LKADSLHQAHARAVQQLCQQRGNAIHLGQKTSYFVFRQHGWNAFDLLRPPNVV
jgi:hypothetical protein